MRILVFSDTHGFATNCCPVIDSFDKVDAIIHAGDIVRDADYIKEKYPDIPLYAVCGNNDYYSDYPYDIKVTLGGKRIFITHGHKYSVRLGSFLLQDLITKEGYDLVIYGHTHVPDHDYFAGSQILNPGSVFSSRTYGIIEIDETGMKVSIQRLD